MSQELYIKNVIKIIVNHLRYKLITALEIKKKKMCGWDMIHYYSIFSRSRHTETVLGFSREHNSEICVFQVFYTGTRQLM